MSTTVTYKGATLTTVENETKTLTTGGTWMEGDLTLTDVTQGGGGGDSSTILDRSVVSISDSTITTLGQFALSRCNQLASITFPNVTTIKANALEYTALPTITDANFGSLTRVEGTAFAYNTALTSVNLSDAFDVQSNTYIFRGCTNLLTAYLPNMMTGHWGIQRMFYGCTNLTTCDIGQSQGVGTESFSGCTALRTLIMRRTTVGVLGGWNASVMGGIYNNPTASTIYVPSALVSQYQQASNWSSAYSAGVTFAPIEGSEYEL